MIQVLLYALLAWFLYKLIFRVIIPIYRTTKQVKKQFGEMRSRMEEHQMKQQGFTPKTEAPKQQPRTSSTDYIEFEEIK
jgi:hypothetical protein